MYTHIRLCIHIGILTYTHTQIYLDIDTHAHVGNDTIILEHSKTKS